MTNAVATRGEGPVAATIEDAMVRGDLSGLEPAQRIAHYKSVCESLGLNPLTRPFQYITFNNQLQLYARREASDQLAALHKVNRRILSRELVEGLYLVTVEATTPDGRTEQSIGAVSIEGLKGEARANALMKGETKAKRRATLSIVGLGWLDETEVETIKGARYVEVDEGGNITGSRPVTALPAASEPLTHLGFKAAYEALGLDAARVADLLGAGSDGSDDDTPARALARWYDRHGRDWRDALRVLQNAVAANEPERRPYVPEGVSMDAETAAAWEAVQTPAGDPADGRRGRR